jgi:hypothetical protein
MLVETSSGDSALFTPMVICGKKGSQYALPALKKKMTAIIIKVIANPR